jgi:hypothetical protein
LAVYRELKFATNRRLELYEEHLVIAERGILGRVIRVPLNELEPDYRIVRGWSLWTYTGLALLVLGTVGLWMILRGGMPAGNTSWAFAIALTAGGGIIMLQSWQRHLYALFAGYHLPVYFSAAGPDRDNFHQFAKLVANQISLSRAARC